MPSHTSSGPHPSPDTFDIPIPLDRTEYLKWQAKTVSEKDAYWRRAAAHLEWEQLFTRVSPDRSAEPWASWFDEGRLSIGANCLVRWTEQDRATTTALCTFEEGRWSQWSYAQLREDVAKAASLLDGMVAHGDPVAVVMDGTRASVVLLLASAWVGAIAVPLSVRLGSRAARQRLVHSRAKFLYLGSMMSQEMETSDLHDAPVHMVGADGGNDENVVPFSLWLSGADSNPADSISDKRACAPDHEPFVFDAQDPFLWVYANAASERPRAAMLRVGGFLVHATTYQSLLFPTDNRTSDLGGSILVAMDPSSVAAQAHGLWGPLCLGWTVTLCPWQADLASALSSHPGDLSESVLLTNPDILDRLRSAAGSSPVRFGQIMSTSSTLRPKTIQDCSPLVTGGAHRITNLWYQTETGCGLVATLPFEDLNRPGALGLPLPGVEAKVIDDLGRPCNPNESGLLTFVPPWPSLASPVSGQKERFENLYFSLVDGLFSTRDGVRLDKEGFFWFMRRIGSEVPVDGISVNTLEVEAVLAHHEQVKEAAVIPIEAADGFRLAAFVVPSGPVSNRSFFTDTLIRHVTDTMGASAAPRMLIVTRALPRTRSGKIVRRLLRRLLAGDFVEGEDLDHLANPHAVTDLVKTMEKPQ